MEKLTPKTLRLDATPRARGKKCGASAIAANKKCSKGAGSKPGSKAGWGEKLYRGAGIAVGIGSVAGGIYGLSQGKDEALGYALAGHGVATSLTGMANVKKANRTSNTRLKKVGNSQIRAGVSLAAYGALGAQVQRGERKQREWNEEQRKAREEWARRNPGGYTRPPRNAYAGDPFKDLGVDPKASDADIKKAYARAARANHPDLGGDEEQMKKINTAYEAIKRRRGRKDDFTFDCLTAEGIQSFVQ